MNWQETALLIEVNRQCRFAIMAWEDLPIAIELVERDRLWHVLQSLLIALSNISRLLWPPREVRAGNDHTLRNVLGISDESPLRIHELRDHFDNMSKTIIEWAKSLSSPAYLDRMALPELGKVMIGANDQEVGHLEVSDVLWVYVAKDQAVYIRGHAIHLRSVVDEVRWLLERTEAALH